LRQNKVNLPEATPSMFCAAKGSQSPLEQRDKKSGGRHGRNNSHGRCILPIRMGSQGGLIGQGKNKVLTGNFGYGINSLDGLWEQKHKLNKKDTEKS